MINNVVFVSGEIIFFEKKAEERETRSVVQP